MFSDLLLLRYWYLKIFHGLVLNSAFLMSLYCLNNAVTAFSKSKEIQWHSLNLATLAFSSGRRHLQMFLLCFHENRV